MTKSAITRERLEWLSQISCRDDIEDIGGDEIRELARMALAAMDSEPVPDGEQLAIENFRSAMEGIGHIRRTLEETFGGLHGTHVEPDVLAECKAICDTIYAAYRHAKPEPVVPDGYVMVPKEPTEEMNKAGWSAMNEHDAINPTYRAMLAAAQQSPGSEPATVPGKWIPISEQNPDCWCLTCRPVVLSDMRFVVCPDCGNKRCPRANDHRNACTWSNEPGQEGSAYPDTPQEEKP